MISVTHCLTQMNLSMSIKELMTRELAPGVDPKMAGRRVGIVMFAIGAFMLALGALKIPRMGLGAEGLMIGWLVIWRNEHKEQFQTAQPYPPAHWR